MTAVEDMDLVNKGTVVALLFGVKKVEEDVVVGRVVVKVLFQRGRDAFKVEVVVADMLPCTAGIGRLVSRFAPTTAGTRLSNATNETRTAAEVIRDEKVKNAMRVE